MPFKLAKIINLLVHYAKGTLSYNIIYNWKKKNLKIFQKLAIALFHPFLYSTYSLLITFY